MKDQNSIFPYHMEVVKMIQIAPNLLKSGMKLAKPVYSINGRFLIPEHVILTSRLIAKLRRFRLDAIYIEWTL